MGCGSSKVIEVDEAIATVTVATQTGGIEALAYAADSECRPTIRPRHPETSNAAAGTSHKDSVPLPLSNAAASKPSPLQPSEAKDPTARGSKANNVITINNNKPSAPTIAATTAPAPLPSRVAALSLRSSLPEIQSTGLKCERCGCNTNPTSLQKKAFVTDRSIIQQYDNGEPPSTQVYGGHETAPVVLTHQLCRVCLAADNPKTTTDTTSTKSAPSPSQATTQHPPRKLEPLRSNAKPTMISEPESPTKPTTTTTSKILEPVVQDAPKPMLSQSSSLLVVEEAPAAVEPAIINVIDDKSKLSQTVVDEVAPLAPLIHQGKENLQLNKGNNSNNNGHRQHKHRHRRYSPKVLDQWTNGHVGAWMMSEKFSADIVAAFVSRNITGPDIIDGISKSTLKIMGIRAERHDYVISHLNKLLAAYGTESAESSFDEEAQAKPVVKMRSKSLTSERRQKKESWRVSGPIAFNGNHEQLKDMDNELQAVFDEFKKSS